MGFLPLQTHPNRTYIWTKPKTEFDEVLHVHPMRAILLRKVQKFRFDSYNEVRFHQNIRIKNFSD